MTTLYALLGELADKSLDKLEHIGVTLPVGGESLTYTLAWLAERYVPGWDTLDEAGRLAAVIEHGSPVPTGWLVPHPIERTPFLRDILGPHTDKTLKELAKDEHMVCSSDGANEFREVAQRDIPEWDSLDAEQRAAEIARIDHEADERAKAHDDERMRRLEDQWQPPSDDELIGWHDVTRSADYWFDPEQVVSPEQAAMLMVGWNPLTDGAPDTSKSDDDPEKLKQYRLFKFRFESAEIRDSKPRTLREWVPMAMDAGLNKSAWVNEYMALTSIKAGDDVVAAPEPAAESLPLKPEQPESVSAACVAEELDYETEVAALFDPVKRETLESMFPDKGKWRTHTERAARNGLREAARVGDALFNPYRAAKWWIDVIAPPAWKWEHCVRVLVKNLPTRSRDLKHLLTGDLD